MYFAGKSRAKMKPDPSSTCSAGDSLALKPAPENLDETTLHLLREAPDLSGVLSAMEMWLQQQCGIDGYFINLFQPGDNTLVCARVHLPPAFASIENTYTNFVFPVDGDNASAQAFSQAIVINIRKRDLDHYPALTKLTFEHMQLRQMIVLPIKTIGGQRSPEGTVTLLAQKSTIPAARLRRLNRFIGEAAPFIHLHGEIATWRTRADSIRGAEMDLQSLLSFIAEVSNLATDRDIYPRIQNEFLRRYDMDVAAVLLLENTFLRCVDTRFRPHDASWASAWQAHCESLSYALDVNEGASSHVFINNHHLYFGNIPSLLGMRMSNKDRANLGILKELESLALFPIRKYGKPIGVLWLGNIRRKNPLTAEQLVLIQHLCDFLGAIIENSQTYTLVEEQRRKIEMLVSALQNRVEVLDQLASRDRLTGLYNFGSFESELKKRLEMFREQQPHAQALSIIMCDVDFFKRFNDTYGHVAGNGVLQEVSNRICRTVRDSDYVARYGGEEFAVLLNRCNIHDAQRLAERIRENIATIPFIIDGIEHFVTLSLGCAEIRPNDDFASFVARADTALYAAKGNGRNRVEVAANLAQ